MLRVGLTGGIASGKSAVAQTLADLGAVVVDADELARQVVEPGTIGLDQVVAAFGGGILAADGSLDRSALAARVFADDVLRRRLERIVHPLVRAQARQREAAAAAVDASAVVVHVIPLLVETGQAGSDGDFDLIVVVDAPLAEQVRRQVALRGLTSEQAHARMRAQASRPQRLAAADEVIVNDGTLEQLRACTHRLWVRLQGWRGRACF